MATNIRSWLPGYVSSSVTRRNFLRTTATGTLGAFILACGGGSNGGGLKLDDTGSSRTPGTVWFAKNDWKLADESKQAVRGGIYRGVTNEDQSGHYDAITLMSSQVPFSAHVYEMLMARNRGPGIDPSSTAAGSPVGALAESWELSDGGATITFALRPNVKFHNIAPVSGRVMEMEDWKSSLERHLALGVYRSEIAGILDKVEFPDARHMVWKLQHPFAPILAGIWNDKFAFPIQPKELNADRRLAESTAIGTGYKILDKYQPSISFQYRKHADYWGGDPFIDRWHVPIVPEYANRYAQFVSGNIMDFTPTAKDVLLLHKDAPEAVIVGNPISDNNVTRMRFGRISPSAQAWADPRVRIAIRRSIDFKTIAEVLSNKDAFAAEGISVEMTAMTHLPQDPGYWLDPEQGQLGAVSANYLFDPAEARKLTAAAGFKDPIPLPFFVPLTNGAITDEDQIVMDSLSKSGTVNLQVTRVANATEQNKYRIDGQFDGLIPQSGASGDADYFISRDYYSLGRADGPQAFPDPKIDELAVAERKEMDVAKRNETLKQFQIFMAGYMAAVPGRHLYTTFRFRWPWLHNTNYAQVVTPGATGIPSPPEGRPVLGGHLQWLDANMPNRNSGG
jgi:peptide/nickel transport system substrate-binding protein